ncbi:DUF6779 domain-containing protein [Corynebacterium sp. H113]|uniref:DUF6779 domain-containing protein n=1 Tax=Corynebacterium sp. H113 TaxID=3133419 RepID=UPI0030A67FC2
MTHPDENQNAYGAPTGDTPARDEWAAQPEDLGITGQPGSADMPGAQADAANGAMPDHASAGEVAVGEGTNGDTSSADNDEDTPDKIAMILMLVFIGLAVLASVIMLFSSSTAWMKIGVLAALWAAVIGAVLVTRYRRQVQEQRTRMKDIEERHQLELDRELATHREQELILEQNYLDSLETQNDNTISELRAEIVALREQLSELLGDGFDDERVALRARAERLRELDGPQSASPLKDPLAHDRPAPRALTHRAEMTASGVVGTHTNHGGPLSADGIDSADDTDYDAEAVDTGIDAGYDDEPAQEPVEVPVVDNGAAGDAEDATRVLGVVPDEAVPAQNVHSHWAKPADDAAADEASMSDDAFDSSEAEKSEAASTEAAADEIDDIAEDDATSEDAAGADVADDASDAADADTTDEDAPEVASRSRHGRRRAEDRQGGLTVAELLAQMREGNEK